MITLVTPHIALMIMCCWARGQAGGFRTVDNNPTITSRHQTSVLVKQRHGDHGGLFKQQSIETRKGSGLSKIISWLAVQGQANAQRQRGPVVSLPPYRKGRQERALVSRLYKACCRSNYKFSSARDANWYECHGTDWPVMIHG
jgi:hypothetical protein